MCLANFTFWSLLHLLFPALCPLCGRALTVGKEPFCPACMADIPPLPKAYCPRCALPFINSASTEPHLCNRCILEPPSYRATYAVGIYQKQLRRAIQRFKYQQYPHLDTHLARLLNRVIPDEIDSDLLIPVPLHPTRLRQRTYNQSLLLAKAVGKYRKLPVAHNLLIKVRPTQPQQTLSANERRRNLAGAYALCQPVTDKKVLLIDDVMTTGVTVELCSRVLLQGGAAEVRIATLGRAPL